VRGEPVTGLVVGMSMRRRETALSSQSPQQRRVRSAGSTDQQAVPGMPSWLSKRSMPQLSLPQAIDTTPFLERVAWHRVSLRLQHLSSTVSNTNRTTNSQQPTGLRLSNSALSLETRLTLQTNFGEPHTSALDCMTNSWGDRDSPYLVTSDQLPQQPCTQATHTQSISAHHFRR
jgi:hypothetical protein